MGCEQTRELAAEIALGIADGAERAGALRHLSDCAECRRAVEQLSVVTDELMMLAPEREPPPGFESRVLARLAPPPVPVVAVARPRTRFRRFLAPVAATAAAAGLAAGLVFGLTGDDRRLAAHYRATLAVAHGTDFQAARLRGAAGDPAGLVYAYRGRPSWIYVALYVDQRQERYRVQLVMRSGRRVDLPRFRLDAATRSGGQTIPVDAGNVASVRLVGSASGEVLAARLAA
jgi:hypothetical protein